MRIRCPVCSTEIRAAEKYIGLKNRCIECQTKFVIPASPDEEIEVLEYGEAPPKKTEVLPTQVEIRKANLPKAEEPKPSGPKKLITKQEGLRGGITIGVSKPKKHVSLDALIGPLKRPESTDEDQPAQQEKPEVKLNLGPKGKPRGTTIGTTKAKKSPKRKVAKHSLEHLPAIDPPTEEQPCDPTPGESDIDVEAEDGAAPKPGPPAN